ncbi:uncharacterized protein Dwil_GK19290 [Drosophila willistoni]|uniref:Uncharacterized protein n=1 Tax=Drosophila willistoni TaxID=7260 RepID=B4MN52_DROWI|nr:uncharacterized protein LOC6638563 [Drosophila willistoni]EDW73608.2 uncharacterized protein Dwil_GK19290 [Drosophila willistoni]
MRSLVILLLFTLCSFCDSSKEEMVAPQLLIDSAPSVVSYQGSSQTHTRFVIAPMGRSLGYVEPINLNRTFRTSKATIDDAVATNESGSETGYEQLKISPVYVHHN